MIQRRASSGRILSECLIIVAFLCSASVFFLAKQKAERIASHEQAAIRELSQLAAHQNREITKHGQPVLMSEYEAWTKFSPARDRAIVNGYCFCIYRVDAEGESWSDEREGLDPSFWIAYAWPVDFDKSGRRLFVVDHSGIVRSCENVLSATFSYQSSTERPPAHLARPPKGFEYPFAARRVGPQKSLQWLSEVQP